jgi:hypothetical protein
MSDLYVEPPHLTTAIYSDRPETETFARMCDVVLKLNCTPLGLLDVAPRDRDFELLSDLGAAREVRAVSPARRSQLIAGQDPELRVLRAGYAHRKFGKVVVEYIQRIGPGPHPIGVSVGSDSLGVPDSLWSASQRKAAYAIAGWSRDVLEAAVSKCNPLYGAIGVEFSLPTVRQLKDGKARLTTELFVSRRLLDRDQSLEEKLRRAFAGGDVISWVDGLFYAGWAPFTSTRATVEDPRMTIESAVSALRRALPDGV